MSPETPLLSPKGFFSTREMETDRLVGLLALVLLVWPALVAYGVSLVFSLQLETGSSDLNGSLWSVAHAMFGQLIGGLTILLLILAGGVHLGTRLAGGDRGAVVSVQLAAWALVPAMGATVAILVIMYFALEPASGAGSAETSIEVAAQQLRSLGPITTAISLLTAVWSGAVLRYGLEYEHGLTSTAAWTIAGIIAAIFALGAIS